jgi:PBP1b-binding outer membrane lipoprotein LpoB
MKTRILLLIIVAAVVFQSCNRAMTPYEAANHPKGKKCRDIR